MDKILRDVQVKLLELRKIQYLLTSKHFIEVWEASTEDARRVFKYETVKDIQKWLISQQVDYSTLTTKQIKKLAKDNNILGYARKPITELRQELERINKERRATKESIKDCTFEDEDSLTALELHKLSFKEPIE